MPKVVSVKSLKLVVLRVERYIAKVDDTLKMETGILCNRHSSLGYKTELQHVLLF